MRFELTPDQRDFAASLESLLAASDTSAVARAWADGDTAPGLALWKRLADQGLTMLATEATPVELCVAFEDRVCAALLIVRRVASAGKAVAMNRSR